MKTKKTAKAAKAKTAPTAKTAKPSKPATAKPAQGEADAAEKQLAERAAKWKGVTATQMFGCLWHKCEDLADMMEECRRRLWEEQFKGKGNARLTDALDQSARCFVDQLWAIATFARHAWIWRTLPQETYDAQDWMRTEEGEKAFEAAKKKYGTPLSIYKTPDGFKVLPAAGAKPIANQ